MSDNINNKETCTQKDTNLNNYQQAYDYFKWHTNSRQNINITYQAIDIDLYTAVKNKVALYWVNKNKQQVNSSYHNLTEKITRFVGVLAKTGFKPEVGGFNWSSCLPKIYISALGQLSFCQTFTPLFSAFWPEPICTTRGKKQANL